MKVILLDEDRAVEVSKGYARNFLLPKGKAILATAPALAQMEKRAEANKQKREEEKNKAEELAQRLQAASIVIKADAGEEGKLFGSVTNNDVVKAINEQFGVEIEKRKLNLNEHIKTIGEFVASVKLHSQVVAHIKISVEKK